VAEKDRDPRETLDTVASIIPPVVRNATPGSACLVVIYGSGAELGKRIPLATEALECGRSIENAIPLDDDAASRRHARFAWTGSSYIVTDLGSTNGTYVNDVAARERTLRDGDQIKIGRTIFKFFHGGNIELSYHEEIYRLMTFDGLTQVHNKRSFEAILEREVSRSQRYKRPLSLVLFDVDHFKRINDSRGHVVGDAVLKQLAALVNTNIRREDTLGRVGGEEFALLAPEIPLDQARRIAEKLRALVDRTPCRFEDQDIPITASFGVAAVEGGAVTGAELYKQADELLYAAKKAGRNRVK
jgi:diguanylate cyclase (GGDEF)-like protein